MLGPSVQQDRIARQQSIEQLLLPRRRIAARGVLLSPLARHFLQTLSTSAFCGQFLLQLPQLAGLPLLHRRKFGDCSMALVDCPTRTLPSHAIAGSEANPERHDGGDDREPHFGRALLRLRTRP